MQSWRRSSELEHLRIVRSKALDRLAPSLENALNGVASVSEPAKVVCNEVQALAAAAHEDDACARTGACARARAIICPTRARTVLVRALADHFCRDSLAVVVANIARRVRTLEAENKLCAGRTNAGWQARAPLVRRRRDGSSRVGFLHCGRDA